MNEIAKVEVLKLKSSATHKTQDEIILSDAYIIITKSKNSVMYGVKLRVNRQPRNKNISVRHEETT